jgi:hypothetical protein
LKVDAFDAGNFSSACLFGSPIPQKLPLDLLELDLNFQVANDESHKLYLDASDIYTAQTNPFVQYDSIVIANPLSFPTAF